MGTEYYYGNIKTHEYIELGKTSIRNVSLWTYLYYDLIRGEIDTSLINTYIKEFHPNYPTDTEHVMWIAKNVTTFAESAGGDLIYKADDTVVFPNEEIKFCEDVVPPFWSEGPLISGDVNPWKKVWDRYFKNRDEMKTKNL